MLTIAFLACTWNKIEEPVDGDDDGFAVEEGDCDDSGADGHPGAEEDCGAGEDLNCDGAVGGEDHDGDGSPACLDCDDGDGGRSPTFEEVCEDAVDNNCNSEVDEGCAVERDGTWILDQRVIYECASGLVSINFEEVFVEDTSPTIRVTGSGTGSQPGTMTGSYSSDTDFQADRTISGSCNEIYEISGTFVSDQLFTGAFGSRFTGTCLDCSNQTWTIQGTR